jgi:hypothetical protein
VLIQAALGLRKHERRGLAQQAFDFRDAPTPVLRAIHVTANMAAERADVLIPQNMRIPEGCVISQVFSNENAYLEAEEDLSSWESSSGRGLNPRPVLVKARRGWNSVDALILPR